jgi:uncharacterized protein RhaS with RHS repeats
LGYWGYRFYYSGKGRWINRDPIDEKGGANLYAMCGNNPVSFADAMGKAVWLLLGPETYAGQDAKGNPISWETVAKQFNDAADELVASAEANRSCAIFKWEGKTIAAGEFISRVKREKVNLSKAPFKTIAGDKAEIEKLIGKMEEPWDVTAYFHHSLQLGRSGEGIVNYTEEINPLTGDDVAKALSSIKVTDGRGRFIHATCYTKDTVNPETGETRTKYLILKLYTEHPMSREGTKYVFDYGPISVTTEIK